MAYDYLTGHRFPFASQEHIVSRINMPILHPDNLLSVKGVESHDVGPLKVGM